MWIDSDRYVNLWNYVIYEWDMWYVTGVWGCECRFIDGNASVNANVVGIDVYMNMDVCDDILDEYVFV